jgi:hypothetical protein
MTAMWYGLLIKGALNKNGEVMFKASTHGGKIGNK